MEQGFLQPDLLMERGDVHCWLPLWLAVTAEKSMAPAGKPAPLKQATPAPQQAAHAAVANGVSNAVDLPSRIPRADDAAASRAGEAAASCSWEDAEHAEHVWETACPLLDTKQKLMSSVFWHGAGEGFITADIDMEERSDDFAAVLEMERAAGHALSLMVRAVCCSAGPLLTTDEAV